MADDDPVLVAERARQLEARRLEDDRAMREACAERDFAEASNKLADELAASIKKIASYQRPGDRWSSRVDHLKGSLAAVAEALRASIADFKPTRSR